MASFSSHVNSVFGSVTYRIGNIIIDPGDDWLFDGVEAVLLTHAHYDHIYGINSLLTKSPCARVYTNETGCEMLLDAKKNLSFYHDIPFVLTNADAVITVKDREIIELSRELSATPFFTPGHNPSCITWVIGQLLLTGDAYIPGIKTVTNLPKGDRKLALESECLIQSLAENRAILPGHKI